MWRNLILRSVRGRTSRPSRGWIASIAWAAPATICSAALLLANPPPLRALRDLAFDTFMTLKPRAYDPNAPVRVIDIDDESLRRLGQWPWPRTTLARLVKTLGDNGAAVIALDILLSEVDRTSLDQVVAGMEPSPARDEIERVWREKGVTNDLALAQTIAQYPVVLALFAAVSGAPAPVKAGFAEQGDPALRFLHPAFGGAALPLSQLTEAAAGVGSINFAPDRDTVVRRVPTFVRIGDQIAPSLAMEALRVAQQASSFLIKASNGSGVGGFGAQTGIVAVRNGDAIVDTEGDGSIRVYYAGPQAARHIPAWRILANEFDPAAVRERILFVGASAAALRDIRATPLQADAAGVDVHAEAIEHILSGAHLARPDYAVGAELIAIIAAGLIAALISAFCAPLLGAFLAIALASILALGSWLFFARAGLLFDPVLPPLTMLAAFSSATIAAYRRTEKDKAQIRDAFGRYVSPAVVEALVADPSKLSLGGEIRPVTVLFSDIRNFTQRSEHLPANEVVGFLNAVHTPMSDAVMRSGGTVDKYIGDGLMAFWNAPLDDADHVRNALRAALAMIDELPRISAELSAGNAAPADAPLGLGVGLHTGLACVGNLGSTKRFDYSIVGDTVNSAARIEPLCKEFGAPIIVSEAIVTAAPDFAFVELDEVALRGRQSKTRIFALLGDEKRAGDSDFLAFRRAHEAALAALRAGAPDAVDMISACEASIMGRDLSPTYRKWRARLNAAITGDVSAVAQ